jgi:hypothetical protein
MTDRRVQILVDLQDMLEEACPLVHQAMRSTRSVYAKNMRFRILCVDTAEDIRTLFFAEPYVHGDSQCTAKLLDKAALLDVPDRARLLADLWTVINMFTAVNQ